MFCLLLVAGATLCASSLGVQLWWDAWHGMASGNDVVGFGLVGLGWVGLGWVWLGDVM